MVLCAFDAATDHANAKAAEAGGGSVELRWLPSQWLLIQ